MEYYIDTNALVKTVKPEAETDAVIAWMTSVSTSGLIRTSQLTLTELRRTLRNIGVPEDTVEEKVQNATDGIDIIDFRDSILSQVDAVKLPRLGTLDAMHLATALAVPDLTGFVTYDKQLGRAVTDSGLTLIQP